MRRRDLSPERLRKAASFYDESPTGQYDEEAAIALRVVADMVDDGELVIDQVEH